MARRRSPGQERAALLAELEARERRRGFTIEGLTNGHQRQAQALRDLLYHPNRRHCWMTARRAGKTTAAAFALALFALANKDANCVYLGLTKDHARTVIWAEIWLPLLEKWGFRDGIEVIHSETRRETIFTATGSVVKFGGTDDMRHVRTMLGTRLDLVVVDEMQDQDGKLVRKLVTKILPPALGDGGRGRMLLCGVKPESRGHFFYETFKAGTFVTQNWSGRDNPHYVSFEAELAEFCRINKLTVDDPLVQSDWLGNVDAFDDGATAFKYRREVAGWVGTPAPWTVGLELPPGKLLAVVPPPGVNRFAIGIDPGSGDRWATVLWGWGARTPCYQLAEWVAPENSGIVDWEPIKAVLDVLHDNYGPAIIYRDPGSTKETTELFGRYMRRYVLKAANKADRRAQVERMASYLRTGAVKVLIGSELESDLLLAAWDPELKAEGRYEWDESIIHPDVADGGRYGIQGWYESLPEPEAEDLTPAQAAVREVSQAIHAALTDPNAWKDGGGRPRQSAAASLRQRARPWGK